MVAITDNRVFEMVRRLRQEVSNWRTWGNVGVKGTEKFLSTASFASKSKITLMTALKHNRVKTPLKGERDFLDDNNKEEASRERFSRSWKAGNYSELGPRWGKSISLYVAVMPDTVAEEFERKMVRWNICKFLSPQALYDWFKELTEFSKKYGNLFSENWKWFVNLENFGGYLPSVPMLDFAESIREWVGGTIIHKSLNRFGGWSEEQFLDDLSLGIDNFLSLGPNVERATSNAKSIEEWSFDFVNWARSGTTSTRSSYRYRPSEGSKWYNAGKTKWRTALSVDSTYVAKILRERTINSLIPVNNAVQKRESGKVRAVISSDDALYWRMSYVSHWLESCMEGHPHSTLYMHSRQVEELWKNTAIHCSRGDRVNTPLDQTHFDWQQNTRMLNIALERIKNYIDLSSVREHVKADLLWVTESIRIAIVELRGSVTIKEGKKREDIRVEKGILSGWRWTAFLDTLFNWAELHCAKELCNRLQLGVNVLDEVSQGDDVKLSTDNEGSSIAIVEAFNSLNFNINPSKFFIDRFRDEYLRQVITAVDVSGYPARSILSILQRNPVTRDPIAGIGRANEQVTSWNTLLARGADNKKIYKLMLRDIANANGISKKQAKLVLATPVAVGGLGWSLNGEKWAIMTNGTVDKEVVFDIHLNPKKSINEHLTYWKNNHSISIGEASVHKYIVSVLDLPKARLKVINMEYKEIGKITPWRIRSEGSGLNSGMKLHAYPKKELPTSLIQEALNEQIRNKDWQWIQEEYIAEELRSMSSRIKVRGGNRVWVDWVSGRLPWHTPVIPGWNVNLVSRLSRNFLQYGFMRLCMRAKFNYTDIKRLVLTSEYYVRDELSKYTIHMGM